MAESLLNQYFPTDLIEVSSITTPQTSSSSHPANSFSASFNLISTSSSTTSPTIMTNTLEFPASNIVHNSNPSTITTGMVISYTTSSYSATASFLGYSTSSKHHHYQLFYQYKYQPCMPSPPVKHQVRIFKGAFAHY